MINNALKNSKDITSQFSSGTLSNEITVGNVQCAKPGDFIIKSITVNGKTFSDVHWIIAETEIYFPDVSAHVILFPYEAIGIFECLNQDDLRQDYMQTDLYKTVLPQYDQAIKSLFGTEHIVPHKDVLSHVFSPHSDIGTYNFVDIPVCSLLTESMIHSDNIAMSDIYSKTGNSGKQLSCFKDNPDLVFMPEKSYWIRTIRRLNSIKHHYGLGNSLQYRHYENPKDDIYLQESFSHWYTNNDRGYKGVSRNTNEVSSILSNCIRPYFLLK